MTSVKKVDPYSLPTLTSKVVYAAKEISLVKEFFQPKDVELCLIEKLKISANGASIRKVLNKNKLFFHRRTQGYSLMTAGVMALHAAVISEKGVVIIEPNKPYSAKRYALNKIFNNTSGTVRICDPFFDVSLLDFVLLNFRKSTKIDILTHKIVEKPAGALSRLLKDLKIEGYGIEVRNLSQNIIHDRYIIDDKNMWLSGNSFNHLGNKESFVVTLGNDMRQSMLSTFNTRWKSAQII